MPMRSELVFEYDSKSFLKSAACSLCGEKMPTPTLSLRESGERVLWFAKFFIEHKKRRHPEAENKLPKAS